MIVLPHLHPFPPLAEPLLLALNLAVVVMSYLFISGFRDEMTRTEERLHTQAWQLRQLVPREAQPPGGSRWPAAR
jgi:hypothetical protein